MLDDVFWRAALGGLGVALAAAPLGCFVVWRRMAYFGASIAHAALLGVALGLLLNIEPALGIALIGFVFAIAIVFLQLPQATAAGRNVRADMLIGKLHKRGDRSGPMLDFFHHLVGAVMLAILLRYIWPEIMGSIRGNETVGLYGIFTLPRWPFVTAVLIGCALTLVQYILLTLGFAQAAFGSRKND